MKSETGKDIARWMEYTEQLLEAEAVAVGSERKGKTESDKNAEELSKTDEKIMQMKLDQLNRRIRTRYYQKDENTPVEKIFQFAFLDKGDHYEFTIPLNILFGAKTQKYCAEYWDEFFAESDIKTSFLDNVKTALKQAGNINLVMKLNKGMTKEQE